VKDRGWVIDFVFWSMIDSWEMESLPKLIVRSWCCRAVARVVHGTQMGIGKEVDCDVMRVVLLGEVTFVVKREKACGGCLGTRRR
jgi:hypothetical protein